MALLPEDDVEDFSVETRGASPAHLLIKIESFSMLSKHGIRKYESGEFEAGGYKWRLIINFDGPEDDYISAYLSMVETSSLPADWEVNAIFNVFLYNHILDNYLCIRGKVQRFHAINFVWGIPKLISKKSFSEPSNGYLLNDYCVFGAEVFVIKSQRVIESVSVQQVTDIHKHDWKISRFSKLVGVWTSQVFPAGGYHWKIKLYPNGSGRSEGHSVSISIECVNFGPHQKIKADILFRIKNNRRDKHHASELSHWFTNSVNSMGIDDLIPIADMRDPSKGFVVDDCCSLETEISVQAVVHGAPKSNKIVWD